MKWDELLKKASGQEIIESKMLIEDHSDIPKIEVQLSRWVKAGRLVKIKRGVYLLSKLYRKKKVQIDYLATLIHRPSYISFEYVLSDYALIPEAVHAITLVTTKRPKKMDIDGKMVLYRHIKKTLFWGYEARGKKYSETFYAKPEKALLDLFLLHPS